MVPHDLFVLPLIFAALIPPILIVAALFITRRRPFAAALVATFTEGLDSRDVRRARELIVS